MKTLPRIVYSSVIALSLLVTIAHAEDSSKARDLLEKLVDKASQAANKVETKSKGLWQRTKENFKTSREDYMKKASSALITMDAEIQTLVESGLAVTSRDYFKTRIEALKQHLDYTKREIERLKEQPSEEAFRVKQKSFDRTLGALGDAIDLAKEEAGL